MEEKGKTESTGVKQENIESDSMNLGPIDKKGTYIRGLLIRIICCCSIFIILFVANMLNVKIFGWDTQRIISYIGKNDVVENLERFIQSML